MNSKILALAQQLKHRNRKRNFSRPANDEITQAEIKWNFSALIFELLKIADLKGDLKRNELTELHRDYQTENSVEINLEGLFSRQWLREVCGRIHIAARIRESNPSFDQIEGDYENKDIFKFLKYIRQLSCVKLILSKNEARRIISQWKELFPETPEWEVFLELKLIAVLDDNSIRLNYSEYWNYASDIIGVKYWYYLVGNETTDDITRLRQWVAVMISANNWPDKLMDLMPTTEKKKFTEACFNLILCEPDLEWSKSEIDKWWWDDEMFADRRLSEVPGKFNLKANSLIELDLQLTELRNSLQWSEIHRSRTALGFFLTQILNFEAGLPENVYCPYEKTKKLAIESLQRPWIFSMLDRTHNEHYLLGALPHLLTNLKTVPWAMLKIGNLNEYNGHHVNEEQLDRQKVDSKEWLKGFEIVLNYLSHNLQDYQEENEVLFEIFSPLLRKITNSWTSDLVASSVIKEFLSRYNQSITLLENSIIEYRISLDQFIKPRLFPFLLSAYFNRINNNRSTLPQNELKSFDLVKWAQLLTVLRLCNIQLLEVEIDESIRNKLTDLSRKVTDGILDFYFKELNEQEQETQTIWEKEPTFKSLEWWREPAGIRVFDLKILVEKLEEYQLFKRFFNIIEWRLPEEHDAILNGKTEKVFSGYSKLNRSFIIRYRLHLRLLLLMHESITRERTWIDQNKALLRKLEVEILGMSVQNREDMNGHADIFNAHYENYSKNTQELSLVQHLFKIALQFETDNRLKLIKSFLDSSLDRLLMIHNFLEDFKERQSVRDAIKKIDVEKFLEDQVFITTVRDALIQATNSENDTEIAKTLLVFLEKQRRPKFLKEEDAFINFQIKAILAYRRRNFDELLKIPIPESPIGLKEKRNEFEKIRNRIKGVFFIEEGKVEDAVEIFKELAGTDPQNPEYQARLFYARALHSLKDEKNAQIDIKEAFWAWSQYEDTWKNGGTPERIHAFGDTITFGKMVYHHWFEGDADFDFLLNRLTNQALFDKDTLALIVKNYNKREMPERANDFLVQAKKYYHDIGEPETHDWIMKLQNSLDKDGLTKALTDGFRQILDLSPEDLVRIMPPYLRNKSKSVGEYLLNLTIQTSSDLLTKINSIAEITPEDKYNDLFVLILQSRLRIWNWYVGDQSRGGGSSNNKTSNLGERDWKIEVNNSEFALYEAMIYRSTSQIETHVRKLIEKYSATIKAGFMIIYYKKSRKKFEASWQIYCKTVNNMTSEVFTEWGAIEEDFNISPEIGRQNIKIGKSKHGEVILYHVFMNINYTQASISSLKPQTPKP